jgi:hypothetical protein
MGKSFRSGLLAGVLAPVVVVASAVFWVYRFTGKVPFPVRREQEGELVVGLVNPSEVPTYWQRWKAEIMPIVDKLCELGSQVGSQRLD